MYAYIFSMLHTCVIFSLFHMCVHVGFWYHAIPPDCIPGDILIWLRRQPAVLVLCGWTGPRVCRVPRDSESRPRNLLWVWQELIKVSIHVPAPKHNRCNVHSFHKKIAVNVVTRSLRWVHNVFPSTHILPTPHHTIDDCSPVFSIPHPSYIEWQMKKCC